MQMTVNNKIAIDLHTHSNYSDGHYDVCELMQLVKNNNGKYIALTDHDTMMGIRGARIQAINLGLQFIAGVEISVSWDKNKVIHIIGLDCDENNISLINNLNYIRGMRYERGVKIAHELKRYGINNALDGALKYCKYQDGLSRSHFAYFLIANNYATKKNIFNKFLSEGKIGYIEQKWATITNAVEWIVSSGGIAVIAHPGRYKLNHSEMLKLIHEFKACGGRGIEVISPSHNQDQVNVFATLSKKYDLLASLGTDFHYQKNAYINIGHNIALPNICNPIYHELRCFDNNDNISN